MLLDKDILLLVVVIVVTESLANDKEGNNDSLPGTHKYCGRNLVNVLTIVCDGIYNNQLTPTPKPAGKSTLQSVLSCQDYAKFDHPPPIQNLFAFQEPMCSDQNGVSSPYSRGRVWGVVGARTTNAAAKAARGTRWLVIAERNHRSPRVLQSEVPLRAIWWVLS